MTLNSLRIKSLIVLLLLPFVFVYGYATIETINEETKANFSGIPGNIVGCVIDNITGLPVAHANIDIMRGNTVITSVFTDKNGIYNVFGLAPKPHLIRVKASDFQSSFRLVVPISNQTMTIDFVLHYLPSQIIGHVFNALTGEPIINAKIEILEDGIKIDSAQSSEDGSYTLSNVTPNHYVIRVIAANFAAVTENITLLNNQILTTNFALEPFGTLVGQVIHAFTGEPVVEACIGMWQDNALATYTHTDANGHFSLNGLGHYQIVVQAGHFHDLQKPAQILSLQTATLNFNLVCLEPLPPLKGYGKVIYKSFAHQVNRTHYLKWKASPDPSVITYRIYRDEKCIAEISANESLVFNDEWRSKKKKIYQITAVNAFGQESQPLPITIK